VLTPLELDIMKAVWRNHPVTVREVQDAIRPTRNLAYTTVMTVMDRLIQKGFLTRQLQSRTHRYSSTIGYGEVRDEAVKTLIDSFFDGSETGLLEFLEGTGTQSLPRRVEVSEPSNFDETLL
jgi:predicted transcriptional regulator